MRRYFASCLALALASAAASAGAGDYFPETAKDFGTTPRGPVLTHYFPVKNTSAAEITLGQPRVSCGCVSATVLQNRLAPGESTAVVATMDSRRIPVANVTRTVTVFVQVVQGFNIEEVQLRVSAIARDDLVLSSDTLAFGTVRRGQGGTATTKITFYGASNWQVLEAQSTGIYVKPAATPAPKVGSETSYEITATLDPACPVGNWTADVWVRTSAPGLDKLRIPVSVNVVAPIDVKPAAIKLGDIAAGSKPTETRLILQSTQPFKILSVKGDGGGVKLSAPGDAAKPLHILTVTVDSAAGELDRKLELTTDHPDMKTVVIPVTGKVLKPAGAAATTASAPAPAGSPK